MQQIPQIDSRKYTAELTLEELRILDYIRKENLTFPKEAYWKEFLRLCFIICGQYPLFCKWVADSLINSGFVVTNFISQTDVLWALGSAFTKSEPDSEDLHKAMRLSYSLRGMAEAATLLEAAVRFDNALIWGVPNIRHALNIRRSLGLAETRCPIIVCGYDVDLENEHEYIHHVGTRGDLYNTTDRIKRDYEKARMKYVVPEVFRRRKD